jgi:hypothetical protein
MLGRDSKNSDWVFGKVIINRQQVCGCVGTMQQVGYQRRKNNQNKSANALNKNINGQSDWHSSCDRNEVNVNNLP